MEYKEMEKLARDIQEKYRLINKNKGENEWTYLEYGQGLVGDMGDLMKMLMAKSNFRGYKGNLDEDIKHELSDCLWSLMVIASELNIDLDVAFMDKMQELKTRIESESSN